MRATCPACGVKDAHEKIISVLRTWFRCNRCSYVWRGSFWSLLYEGSPLGSRRDREAATVPTPTSLEPRTPLDAAQLETELTVVEDALEHPARTDRDQPLPLPPSPGPADPETSSAPRPTSPASATERQDANDWLDGVEGAIAPRRPGPTPVEIGRPTATGDRQAFRIEFASAGEVTSHTDRATPAASSARHAREAGPETANMQRDLEDVPAGPPQKPATTDGPERRPAALPVSAGRTDSLDDTLRRLEVFDAELTHAKQRLGSTEHAYSAVVKRWKPTITDRPNGAADESERQSPKPNDDADDGH